jgi:hypothetical protein
MARGGIEPPTRGFSSFCFPSKVHFCDEIVTNFEPVYNGISFLILFRQEDFCGRAGRLRFGLRAIFSDTAVTFLIF